tara:strand:+ start:387 stop:545 length:159 start_codon:yes stop_codon:yes gene_type:complete
MSALVLIELNGSEVSANSRAAITAASQLSDTIDALVLTNLLITPRKHPHSQV